MTHSMNGRIFINYRRDVDGGSAGRIYDHLCRKFPPERIFFDIDGIRPGMDFEQTIHEAILAARLVLAVIGPAWVDCRLADGRRRIDQADDYVRLELETALSLGKTILPVLVDQAVMPGSALLPASLAALGKRNAVHVRHHSFAGDVAGLVTSVQWLLEQGRGEREEVLARSKPKADDGAGKLGDATGREAPGPAKDNPTQWTSAQGDLSRHLVSPSWQPLRGRSGRG